MAVVEIKVLPVGTDDTSLHTHVIQALQPAVDRPEVSWQVTPTATVLSGPLPVLWQVVQDMHQHGFEAGADRVLTSIFIDDRRDAPMDTGHMVHVVTSALPREATTRN